MRSGGENPVQPCLLVSGTGSRKCRTGKFLRVEPIRGFLWGVLCNRKGTRYSFGPAKFSSPDLGSR